MRKSPHTSLLLANSSLPVPALEEDLFWVCIEETHHSEVGDNLCPGNIQFLKVGAVFPNFIEKHVVWNIPFESQLGQTGTIHWGQDLHGLLDIGYFTYFQHFHFTLLQFWQSIYPTKFPFSSQHQSFYITFDLPNVPYIPFTLIASIKIVPRCPGFNQLPARKLLYFLKGFSCPFIICLTILTYHRV